MIATLETACAVAEVMSRRAWAAARSFPHPAIVYAAHGDNAGHLVLVDRRYRVMGAGDQHCDYAAPDYAHLRIPDSPQLRALAAAINEDGRVNWPHGPRVPIIFLIKGGDSRETYCTRLRAVLALVRGGRHE